MAIAVGLRHSSADATSSKHVLWRSGQYLFLITRDSNNKYLPLACAIVPGETKEAYQYFARELKKWGADKYLNLEESSIISDRDKGLEQLHLAFELAHHLSCFKHIVPNCKRQAGKTKDGIAWAMQRAQSKDEYLEFLENMRVFNPEAAKYLHSLPHEEVFFYAYNEKGVSTYNHSTSNSSEECSEHYELSIH